MLCARRESELKLVADKCESLGAQLARYTIADVSKTEDCQCGGPISPVVCLAGESDQHVFSRIESSWKKQPTPSAV